MISLALIELLPSHPVSLKPRFSLLSIRDCEGSDKGGRASIRIFTRP